MEPIIPDQKINQAKFLYCLGLYHEARAELKSIEPEFITPEIERKIKTIQTTLDIALAEKYTRTPVNNNQFCKNH